MCLLGVYTTARTLDMFSSNSYKKASKIDILVSIYRENRSREQLFKVPTLVWGNTEEELLSSLEFKRFTAEF